MPVSLLLLAIVFTPPQGHIGIVENAATLQKLATGFAFTEGPSSDKIGNVYFTDQPNDRIMRWSIDGKLTEWMKPSGRANGTAFDRRGNLVVCADENNQLWSIDRNRKAKVLVDHYQGKLLNGPNDVWIRPDGGLYITDPLYPRPYWKRSAQSQLSGHHVYFLPRNSKALVQVTDDLVQPNGIVGTPDGKNLYISDIDAGKTYRYSIQRDGRLTNKTLFCLLGSDGMTIDNLGDIYCTGNGVTVFDPEGKKILHVNVPEGWTGNVKFGGADHRLLFITASTSIYGLRMKVRGG